MLLLLVSSLLWSAALAGLGSLPPLSRMLGPLDDEIRLPLRVVSGTGLVALASTLTGFFAGVGAPFTFVALGAGLGCAVVFRRELVSGLDRVDAAAGGAILVLLSAAGAFQVTLYDSGLYHLQAVRWAQGGPLPLGLANLHERLGVGTLWWGVAAAAGPAAVSTIAAFPLLFAAWRGMRATVLFGATPSRLLLAATPAPLALSFLDRSLPSPSPDLAVTLLTILALALAARALERPGGTGLGAAFLVALLAVTVKLSAVVLAAGLLLVLVLRDGARALRPVLVPASILLSAWFARGVVATGYLLYPLEWSRLDAAGWAVPADIARADLARIEEWARRPFHEGEGPVPFAAWIGEWIARNGKLLSWPPALPALYAALLVGGLALLALVPRGKRFPPSLVVPWLVAAVSLAFWFLSAPDPRFAHGLLFAVALLPAAHAAAGARLLVLTPGAWTRAFAGGTLLLVASLASVELLRPARAGRRPFGLLLPPPPPAGQTRPAPLSSGLVVSVPVADDRCWDAPLPCTPVAREGLRAFRDSSGRIRRFDFPR